MLSKSKLKYIRSLELKKFRNEYNVFVAEGNKLVGDVFPYFDCELLIAKRSWLNRYQNLPAKEVIVAEDEDVPKASFLKTPQDVLAVFKKPSYLLEQVHPEKQLVLVLDGIQDPGNLGTIVRLADWYGIEQIVCSPDTVDIFSPKAVQATMGAIARVKVHYTDLQSFLSSWAVPRYGTFLDGQNIYARPLSSNGILVMGNEGKGIRRETEILITEKLYIPNYPPQRETSESLNVAIATAIVCAEFRRRQISSL